MIKIDKSSTPSGIAPFTTKRWTGQNGVKMTLAARDLQKAIRYYADPNNFTNNEKLVEGESFTFVAYSHKNTKSALKDIFQSKCAYCESYIAHIEPGDIEHFRPKGAIQILDGSKLIPGYYWLGADWENLLLSCINCNRPNKQRIDENGEEISMGKGIKFPIKNEQHRVRGHIQSVEIEDPLLLNPCIDTPDDHIRFEEDGTVLSLSEKGQYSIETYGLFRVSLVLKRFNEGRTLRNVIFNISENIFDLEKPGNSVQDEDRLIQRLTENYNFLLSLFQSESEYIAMKQQIITNFIADHPPIHEKLKGYGLDLQALLPN